MGRPFDPDLVAEPPQPSSYTVTEINLLAKQALERNFRSIYVVGEVSNLHFHRSGHVYFTLKDSESQLDAVMWKGMAKGLGFKLEGGMEVLAFGDLSIYTRGGRYQLVARRLEPRGEGALEVAFRQLVERLLEEGLFDEARKRPLPFLPRRIALVTSPQGAAVRDMLAGIWKRFSRADVAVYSVKVQGEGAAGEIATAISALNRAGGFDVIVVGRGGGSLEDLWAFNEEVVARAVFASGIPVVSAVGHERDVSISDMVADARAITPTQVGELVVPDEAALSQRLLGARRGLVSGLSRRLERARDALELARRHPVLARPEILLLPLAQRLDAASDKLVRGGNNILKMRDERLKRALVALESLSPLGVLARGYSVTRDDAGNVLTDVAGVDKGHLVETILHRGRMKSRVEEVFPAEKGRHGQEG